MKLYVFNPESDLALANNKANYMAPASARQMVRDLAVLPVWYAEPGSALLAPSAYNADFMKRIRDIFPLQVELVTEPELPQYAQTELMPWGCQPFSSQQLVEERHPGGTPSFTRLVGGIPETLLPPASGGDDKTHPRTLLLPHLWGTLSDRKC